MYKEARRFGMELKRLASRHFPDYERYGLQSQLRRALDSVVLNIAEGSDRGTDKDFAHFLNVAHTSLNEVIACLDIAGDEGYLTEVISAPFVGKAAALSNQLTAFRNVLLRTTSK